MDAMRDGATSSASDSSLDATELAELLALTTTSSEVNHPKDNLAPFQLYDTLSTVMGKITNPAHQKGISVDCIIDDPELKSATLLGDKLRIQQVLANFCWSSLKCTYNGGIKISVDCDHHSATKPGFKRFCFKVADTGIGQIDELGLGVCRKLAGLMGGKVRCASVPGKGSTFTIELDLQIDTTSLLEPATPCTSGEFRLPYPPSGKTSCSSDNDTDPVYPRAPRNSHETDNKNDAATNEALGAAADDAGHSGRLLSNMDQIQQHFEKYMMANPWASGGQVYQPPHPTGLNQEAPVNLMAANFRVLRKTVYDDSVSVLIEMRTSERVLQQWGSATIADGDMDRAIRAATDDATRRIASFFQSHKSAQARMIPGSRFMLAAPAPSVEPSESESAAAEGRHPGTRVTQLLFHGAQNSLTVSRSPDAETPSASADVEPSRPEDEKPKDDKSSLVNFHAPKASGVSSADPLLPSRISVLVVDGDPKHRKEVQEALECSSSSCIFEVTLAADGQDVIKLGIAQGIRYDVILLGEKMKHLNGSDTVSVYRRYEAANRLPGTLMILLTSGNLLPMQNVFYQSCGIDGTLQKPTMTQNLAKDIVACFWWRVENGLHRPLGPFLCRTGKLLAEATDAKSSVWIKDTENFDSSLFFGDSNLEVFGRRRGDGPTGNLWML